MDIKNLNSNNVDACANDLCPWWNREKCLKIEQVTAPVQHGEGPLWHTQEQALYYVDTFKPAILRWKHSTNEVTSHVLETNSVGFIIPIKHTSHTFIVCQDRWINKFTWNGASNDSAINESELCFVDESEPKNQFNDGKVDAKGRLWGGTLTRQDDLSVAPYGGNLYLIKGKSLTEPEIKIPKVSISNGLAWSKDNKKFFYIDSETRKIVSYNFDLESGNIDSPHTLFDFENYPELQGIPDGMTIDTDDNLWVAVFGGHSVIKIDSNVGLLLDVIKIPATYVTSATFGGVNLDVLYVTTSKLKLEGEQEAKEPLAGSVFAVYNLGVKGFPANDFKM